MKSEFFEGGNYNNGLNYGGFGGMGVIKNFGLFGDDSLKFNGKEKSG
jgi:hypothetical protein